MILPVINKLMPFWLSLVLFVSSACSRGQEPEIFDQGDINDHYRSLEGQINYVGVVVDEMGTPKQGAIVNAVITYTGLGPRTHLQNEVTVTTAENGLFTIKGKGRILEIIDIELKGYLFPLKLNLERSFNFKNDRKVLVNNNGTPFKYTIWNELKTAPLIKSKRRHSIVTDEEGQAIRAFNFIDGKVHKGPNFPESDNLVIKIHYDPEKDNHEYNISCRHGHESLILCNTFTGVAPSEGYVSEITLIGPDSGSIVENYIYYKDHKLGWYALIKFSIRKQLTPKGYFSFERMVNPYGEPYFIEPSFNNNADKRKETSRAIDSLKDGNLPTKPTSATDESDSQD